MTKGTLPNSVKGNAGINHFEEAVKNDELKGGTTSGIWLKNVTVTTHCRRKLHYDPARTPRLSSNIKSLHDPFGRWEVAGSVRMRAEKGDLNCTHSITQRQGKSLEAHHEETSKGDVVHENSRMPRKALSTNEVTGNITRSYMNEMVRPRLKIMSTTTILDSKKGGKRSGRTDELRYLPISSSGAGLFVLAPPVHQVPRLLSSCCS